MPRSMVGLLAAVGVAMSALVPFAHGFLILLVILEAAVAAGLVAFATAPDLGLPKVLAFAQKKAV